MSYDHDRFHEILTCSILQTVWAKDLSRNNSLLDFTWKSQILISQGLLLGHLGHDRLIFYPVCIFPIWVLQKVKVGFLAWVWMGVHWQMFQSACFKCLVLVLVLNFGICFLVHGQNATAPLAFDNPLKAFNWTAVWFEHWQSFRALKHHTTFYHTNTFLIWKYQLNDLNLRWNAA